MNRLYDLVGDNRRYIRNHDDKPDKIGKIFHYFEIFRNHDPDPNENSRFREKSFGIALQIKSPYRDRINIARLKLIEEDIYQEINDKWFGS
jgi:ABC-type amino acid transport substrate-binding protein